MLNVAHNTSTTLACRSKLPFYPALYMNHSLLIAPVYNVFDLGAGDLQGLLTIDGNETCGTLQLNCIVGAETIYVILLTIEGLCMATNVTVEPCDHSPLLYVPYMVIHLQVSYQVLRM